MFEQSLIQLGLTYTQSVVYETMLKSGALPAGKIAKKASFKRGLVYKILEDLEKAGLVQKEEKEGRVAVFEVKHPLELRDFAEKKQQEARDAKLALEGVLPAIVSEFNLTSSKPGILFFEGEDGLEKVLEDTLKSKTEICLFLNKGALEEEGVFRDINEKYRKKRERLGITKKIIRVGKKNKEMDTREKNRNVTEIRYFNKKNFAAFKASVQIYDNKISYQIIDGSRIISVIIENKHLYNMNKSWFEYLWEISEN